MNHFRAIFGYGTDLTCPFKLFCPPNSQKGRKLENCISLKYRKSESWISHMFDLIYGTQDLDKKKSKKVGTDRLFRSAAKWAEMAADHENG